MSVYYRQNILYMGSNANMRKVGYISWGSKVKSIQYAQEIHTGFGGTLCIVLAIANEQGGSLCRVANVHTLFQQLFLGNVFLLQCTANAVKVLGNVEVLQHFLSSFFQL